MAHNNDAMTIRTAVADAALCGVGEDTDADVVDAVADTAVSGVRAAIRNDTPLLDFDEYNSALGAL